MNGLDIVILVAFFASALIGALRGFTKEILSLFSWGGAVSLSYIFLPFGRGFVHPYIANPMMADGATLFCIFIISLIFLSIIANIIAGYIHESSFRGVDHSLGFGFGILRGVVFISTAELLFSTFSPRNLQSESIQNARFIPMVRKGGDMVLHMLPAGLRATILEQAMKVENQVNAKVQDQLKSAASGVFSGGVPVGPSGTPGYPGGTGTTFGGTPSGNGMAPNGQGYGPGAQPPNQYPQQGQQPGQQQGQYPMQGPGQNMPQQGPYQGGQQPGAPVQSQMLVIRPPQQGQVPQFPPVLEAPPTANFRQQGGAANQDGGSSSPQQSYRLGGTNMPQDRQTTVDNLARLNPKASPSSQEEAPYTQGQRDDMNRLFQAADGE